MKKFLVGGHARAVVRAIDVRYGEKERNIKELNISKSFENIRVLTGVNISLDSSNIGVVTSPSGKGKTTLLRILAGLEKEDSGRKICLNGKIGFMFQENRLLEDYSVKDNLNIINSICDENDKQKYLSMLGLENVYERKVKELSGGMKRRVALLRTLLYPCDYLLLDEPFTGLDKENAGKCVELIHKLQMGRCVIITQHDEDYLSDLLSEVNGVNILIN